MPQVLILSTGDINIDIDATVIEVLVILWLIPSRL